MSLTLKLSSLAIRTLSKPIANQIKAQAREHERFRRICVSVAQGLHRLDMRLRLGTIRDNATSQRRAAAEAEVRKYKSNSPTVKTEAEAKAEEEAIAKAKAVASEAEKPPPKPHIRPLSESKAIESGATFISESFLFLVAGSLILFESWRSRRKENTRRDDVAARLNELEETVEVYRTAFIALEKSGQLPVQSRRILQRVIEEVEPEPEVKVEEPGWLSTITSYFSFGQNPEQQTEQATAGRAVEATKPLSSVSEPAAQTAVSTTSPASPETKKA
ncbi:optic atrophy 3 protein-domain-containing protein [Aspergillus karnatakaensis]|uniref:OPA3 family protein n=1 Tax=Aspergillus karnatakaensis TaxID=1810916 RepID=UPI003CCE1A2A